MSIDFWEIVERVKNKAGDDLESRPEYLKEILLTLSPKEVANFDLLYRQKLVDSYRWDLWGAAYLINGGCSDDAFDYFRDFLISEGQAVFEAAIKDPESLASIENVQDAELEQYRYSISEAYEELTGQDMPRADLKFPTEPFGAEWDEDELEGMFPILAKKYG